MSASLDFAQTVLFTRVGSQLTSRDLASSMAAALLVYGSSLQSYFGASDGTSLGNTLGRRVSSEPRHYN